MMPPSVRGLLRQLLVGVSLVWLTVEGGRFAFLELQFMLEMLALTALTRTLTMWQASSAYSWGVGVTAPLVVLIGRTTTAIGIDLEGTFMNVIIVPAVEEILKACPVIVLAWLLQRRRGLLPNPSDLLLLGCMVGTGFALVEVSYWDVARLDERVGPHIGGLYFFPTAFGRVAYVGHAAATGLVGMAIGWSLRRRARGARDWWLPAAVALAWVTIEHALSNLDYARRSGRTLLMVFGGGRLTPWIFLAVLAVTVALDVRGARAAFGRSRRLRSRLRMLGRYLGREISARRAPAWGAVRLMLDQSHLLNAMSWYGVTAQPRAVKETRSVAEPV